MSKVKDPARLLAYQMLYRVLEQGGYSNLVLKEMAEKTNLTTEQRSFSTALFYGTITRYISLDYYLKPYLPAGISALDGSVRTLLRMGAWQVLFSRNIPLFAAVNETVVLSRQYTNPGATKLINAVLRNLGRDFEQKKFSLESAKFPIRYALSPEISGCLQKWYGKERAETLAQGFLGVAKITARCNRLRTSPEELIEILAQEGVSARPSEFMTEGLSLDLQGKVIASLESFRQGLFMIQDQGAMLASGVLAPKPGEKILDICAAPGGKSCHLAELSLDKAEIIALDVNPSRLMLIRQNQERLGLTSIKAYEGDGLNFFIQHPELQATFDGVLVDVPCSGLGLLLRKPDIRLQMTYAKIQELLPLQKAILEQSALGVKPGGRLLYSTCTINPAENQEQVQSFLADHAEFESCDLSPFLPLSFLTHHKDSMEKGWIQLLPDQDGCDGFFIALLRRKNNG